MTDQIQLLAPVRPPVFDDVVILEADALELVQLMRPDLFDLIIADPPWQYTNQSIRSSAGKEYELQPMAPIVDTLRAAYRIAKDDTYMLVWCTWPTVFEFVTEILARAVPELQAEAWKDRRRAMTVGLGGWEPVSGGSWTKWLASGQPTEPGVGFHWRGDNEPLLLLRKGNPKPRGMVRNAHVSPRTPAHSEKPVEWLVELVEAYSSPHALVFELYGGTCPVARASRSTRRRCVAVELDPQRAEEARVRLAQHRVDW